MVIRSPILVQFIWFMFFKYLFCFAKIYIFLEKWKFTIKKSFNPS